MKQLKYKKEPKAHHIYIQGNKNIQLEPDEVHLHFPGGVLSVTRCTNGEYWTHLNLKDIDDESNQHFKGQLADARIDCENISVNESELGSLNRPDLYHLAIKVKTV